DPQASEAMVEKDRGRFSSAPLTVAVVAFLQPGHKVPAQAQLLTAGSVCLVLPQAAQALGFGSQWLTAWAGYDPVISALLGQEPGFDSQRLTGWADYDPAITGLLGLKQDEKIAGFIHIGTPRLEVPERERPDPLALLSDWNPDV